MQYSIDIWVRLFVFGHDVSPYLLMFSGSEKKYKREMKSYSLQIIVEFTKNTTYEKIHNPRFQQCNC